MSVTIKTPDQIEKMRVAGRLVAETHRRVREFAQPGVTTKELDELVYSTVVEGGGKPLFTMPYLLQID